VVSVRSGAGCAGVASPGTVNTYSTTKGEPGHMKGLGLNLLALRPRTYRTLYFTTHGPPRPANSLVGTAPARVLLTRKRPQVQTLLRPHKPLTSKNTAEGLTSFRKTAAQR
jgi:hypothetical protein